MQKELLEEVKRRLAKGETVSLERITENECYCKYCVLSGQTITFINDAKDITSHSLSGFNFLYFTENTFKILPPEWLTFFSL